MPYSKNPGAYPELYGQLLEKAYGQREPIVVPMTQKEAARTKAMLYAYIRALEQQEDANRIAFEYRVSRHYRQVVITDYPDPDGARWILQLQNRNFLPEMQALSAALGLTEDPLPAAPRDEPEGPSGSTSTEDTILDMFGDNNE